MNIDSVSFDLAGCRLRKESEWHRLWSDDAGIYYNLSVGQRVSWPFDLRNPDAASRFYAQQCADNKGVMLEMEVVSLRQFIGLRGLFKYRSPVPNSLGMMFVHILWIPFAQSTVQLNVESVEAGTTGAREAAVMLIEGDRWPKPPSSEEPILVGSTEEMFSRMRAQPLWALPSDDEKYDQDFSDHPLSKVRRRMREVMATLAISAQPRDLMPFREGTV